MEKQSRKRAADSSEPLDNELSLKIQKLNDDCTRLEQEREIVVKQLAELNKTRERLDDCLLFLRRDLTHEEMKLVCANSNAWDEYYEKYSKTSKLKHVKFLEEFGFSGEDLLQVDKYLHYSKQELYDTFEFAFRHGFTFHFYGDEPKFVLNLSKDADGTWLLDAYATLLKKHPNLYPSCHYWDVQYCIEIYRAYPSRFCNDYTTFLKKIRGDVQFSSIVCTEK